MTTPEEAVATAQRWARAVLRQIDRLVDARAAVDDGSLTAEDWWAWRNDAHFMLNAADHLGDALRDAHLQDRYSEIDWVYVNHLRNAWEHDDDRQLYRDAYGAPHGSSVWSPGQPGYIDELNVATLRRVARHFLDHHRREVDQAEQRLKAAMESSPSELQLAPHRGHPGTRLVPD